MSADSDAGATSNDFVSLRPDQLVGRYRIVSVLGQGSFGITYRAIDSELGREVAIKEYLPAALAVRQDGTTVAPRSGSAAADFAWGRDRFIAEGRTLAAFHRLPGVVQVHDFLEANGTAYLAMELVRGRTLLEQIERQGPLDAAGLDGILSTLLDGLEQVHGVGFLHRDIKPANVLVDGNGHPVLIDFGASRAALDGRSQAMTAIFTPGYAAVEQFTAATQGPWTDIYGLAATVHHAITGRAPPNAIDRIIDDTYVALADSGLPFPRTLLAGIDAGLAVRAADRPQSIAAWRKILSATPVGAGAAPATVVMPRAATAAAATAVAASRMRLAMMLAAGVAVLCLLAGGWFAIGSRPSGPAVSESSSPSSSSTASSSAGPSSPSPSAQPAVAAAPAQDRAQEQLEEARRAQRAAFEEAARLRAEADARRKLDEEAALRRKIEEEMRQKAEAEEAARRRAVEDAKRQAAADMAAAAAARQQAESDARNKAEAEAAVRLKAEEADLKGAEAAEAALRLGQPDRQRIQTALTALGFLTGGNDGVFGARSREMIAAWQKKAGRAATGYLSVDSQAALLREAAPSLARHDEEQRKLAAVAQPQPAAPAKVATPCEGTYRVQWCRAAYQGYPSSCWNANATISSGVISGGWTSQGSTDRQTFSGNIDAGGAVRVTYNGVGQQTHVNQAFTVYMTGRVEGNVLSIAGRAGANGRDFSATIQCR
ncbi:Putative peptidoglycan binding domain-containing protein [Rhodospirillales bacterium URHD0017]|nr:Putative peptidoglycan binding domain-containing protein [Rhodospirillales bacterium URHD0017]